MASTLSVGGATTMENTLSVAMATVIAGAASIGGVTTAGGTFNSQGAATLDSTLSIGGVTTLEGQLSIGATTTVTASTTLTNPGGTALTVVGDAEFFNDVLIHSNLLVRGMTTTLNTQQVQIDDKNLELGISVTDLNTSSGVTGLAAQVTASQVAVSLVVGTSLTLSVDCSSASGNSALADGDIIQVEANDGTDDKFLYLKLASSSSLAGDGSTCTVTLDSTASVTQPDGSSLTAIPVGWSIPASALVQKTSHSDTSADGGGLILKGTSDHSLLWSNDTGTHTQDYWSFSDNLKIPGDTTAVANSKRLYLGDKWYLVFNPINDTLDFMYASTYGDSGSVAFRLEPPNA